MSGHLDDFLSAYADGELTTEQQAVVDAHLGVCPACRGELAATRQAKSWVAGLPAVLPPFGFFERMLLDGRGPQEPRSPWPVRVGAISLAATASIWFGVIGLARLDRVQPGGMPALNSLMNLHEGASAPASGDLPAGEPDAATHRQAESLGVPDQMRGYQLTSVVDRGDKQQAVYRDGENVVSVFVYPHAVINPIGLPIGSRTDVVGGQLVWIVPSEPGPMVVAQRGDAVVVVLGSEPAAPSLAEEVDPPTPDRSLADRVQDAGEGLLEAFGFG